MANELADQYRLRHVEKPYMTSLIVATKKDAEEMRPDNDRWLIQRSADGGKTWKDEG